MTGDSRRRGGERMVVAARAVGVPPVRGSALKAVYLDDEGRLPDEDEQARLKGCLQAMFKEATRIAADVELQIRPWQADDGANLVDWRTALRRWAARGGPRP